MRHPIFVPIGLCAVLALSACDKEIDTDAVDRKLQDINVIDESDLNEVMLGAADPNEAVSYFQRAVKGKPDRIDLQRGLALSLVRAKRPTEAVSAWKRVIDMEGSVPDDQIQLADAYIRDGQWDKAEEVLDAVPPTVETFKRYRLEAMIADGNEEWKKADSFYETAVGLTTTPASVMNNWGYSKLTRGDYDGAERLFTQAIRQDSGMFTAKNNLVLARGAQGNYQLPVVPMSQQERAELLYPMGLSAVKRGDVETGKGLFRDAIETHPQYFEAAVRSLRALESGVAN